MQEPITLQLSTLLKTSHDTSFKPFNLSYFNYLFTSFPLLAWFSTFTFLSSDLLTTAGKLLNFGVSGDRTRHVLWRIDNGEIPLDLQVAFVHCGTNNLDRDNPAEIRDGLLQLFILYRRKSLMLTLLYQVYFQEIKRFHLGVIRLSW